MPTSSPEPKLCGGTSYRTRWYPVPVKEWTGALETLSFRGTPLITDLEVRRNIAYNLQYLEYLQQTLEELNLSSVLIAQTYKSYIIVAVGVVESLLYFLNIATGGKEKRFFDVLVRLEKDAVLGKSKPFYETLQSARVLRNKVHLHELKDDLGTDYTTFGSDEFKEMKATLERILMSRALGFDASKKALLDFLRK